MKKIIGCVSLCCLVLLVPITAGLPMHYMIPNRQIIVSNQRIQADAPPDWAKGNFSGVWGLTVLGVPLDPAGWIKGYYQHIGLGQFDGTYATFNETNATSFLKGIMLWIFFLGGAGNIQTGKGTWVTGIGVANETHFYWRINAIIGPSFYIYCQYYAFSNETK
jgi:hypothetical protein